MKALLEAIMDAYETSVLAGLCNGLFLCEAPKHTALPYVTFQIAGNQVTRDTDTINENVLIQFMVWSETLSVAELFRVRDALVDLFDFCELTPSTGASVEFSRENELGPVREEEDVGWQYMVAFHVLYEHE